MSRPRRKRERRTSAALPLLDGPFAPPRYFQPPYEWLAPEQLDSLHEASLTILENTGIDFLDDEALTIWQAAGAKVDLSTRRVWPDRGLIEEAITSAPSSFRWRARNEIHSLTMGPHVLAFGPCGGMAYATDLDHGRRPGTLADYESFLRLSQVTPLLHFGSWEQVAPQDVGINVRHLQRLHSSYTLTDKIVLEAAHGRIISADVVEAARIVFGSLDGDPVTGDVINASSPLRFDERMLGGLITFARAGQVTFITPFILAGATGPVTVAGALAQQNAEVLAGVALTQLVRPGAPVIYGGFTTNIDLRTGSPAFGTPEGAWALLVGGQLARRYRLPYRSSGGLTSAKTADAQAGYEAQWNLWPAAMAHTNLLMHSAGWLDGGLTASFEKFVIDLENLAMLAHFLGGFAFNEESLAVDSIHAVGPGRHHLDSDLTLKHYREAFYGSTLADRLGFEAWSAAGEWDAAKRANAIWKEMLSRYEQPPLDAAVAEELAGFVERRSRELAGARLYE